MNPIVKNILAFIAGFAVMMVVNMGLIMLLGTLFPPPEGVDINDIESINDNLHRYSTFQLLMPFIAHAVGTLAGAFTACKIANSYKTILVILLAALHFAGGYMMVDMLSNSPTWFNVIDLALAYFPMAWIGYRLAGGSKDSPVSNTVID